MSNINKQAQTIISDIRLKHGSDDFYAPIIRWDEFKVIAGALEAAEKRIAELEAREVTLPDVEKWRSPEAVCAQNAYRALVGQELSAAGIITKVGE